MNARLLDAAPRMYVLLQLYVRREELTFKEKQSVWEEARDLLAELDGDVQDVNGDGV